ncbi:hypothetical protein V1509DRAFT_632813 [Lipomyces kononenkoae]
MTTTSGQPSTGWSVVLDVPPGGVTVDNRYWQFASYFSAPRTAASQWTVIQSALRQRRKKTGLQNGSTPVGRQMTKNPERQRKSGLVLAMDESSTTKGTCHLAILLVTE